MADDQIQACQECGASIYPEHLRIHSAGLWQGRLMCPHCLAEKKMLADPPKSAESLAIAAEDEDSAPISLLPPERSTTVAASAAAATATAQRSIRTYGGASPLGSAAEAAHAFRRPLSTDGTIATRCKTFHSKLNDASLAHMDRLINEWVDGHDDVHVKFATSSVGVFEGKHAEPNLIVTLFY